MKRQAKLEGSHHKEDQGNYHPRCICNGPHLVGGFLNQDNLNAIVVESNQDSELELEDYKSIAPLQLLGAIQAVKDKIHLKLIFIWMRING